MLLADVAAASADVVSTTSRTAKRDRLAALLAGADADEIAVVVSWLSGELTQRQIGVGWAAIARTTAGAAPAESATLTVAEVQQLFGLIGATRGAGSQAARHDLLVSLFTRATAAEGAFLRGLLSGELRQGAQIGVMTDAVARAAGLALPLIRRAAMLSGDLAAVAALALTAPDPATASTRVAEVGLVPGRAIGPMLAQTATSVTQAMLSLAGGEPVAGSEAVIEYKLDGARIQLHRTDDGVRLFTRSLDDITARLPEVVAAVEALPVRSLVADAEVIALRPDGRPRPFAETASRVGTRGENGTALSVFVFDLLHLDGADLIDLPAADRAAELARIVPEGMRVPRLVTDDPAAAEAFLVQALQAGHEGVMVKSPSAPYEAGRRGAGWLKVKPVHTLDLVVIAVERGSGRRRGTLSNIHLGARDAETGEMVMVGKTFKGMTDAMLAWQTERFTELAIASPEELAAAYVVALRPEQVVEIGFDGVQHSTRYPGGAALRFARVLRYRHDKTAAEADTIETVRGYLPPA